MRTPLAASTLAIFSAAVLAACASTDPGAGGAGVDSDSPDTASTSQALTRRGTEIDPPSGNHVIVDPSPPTPPHPPRFPQLVDNPDVLAPICIAPARRFDVRRMTRSCENLPGASVVDGVTMIPGNGGHFRVGRLLAGTTAPAAFQSKACSYTWEPDACAGPDSGKLLLEAGEQLTERPALCVSNPASCGPSTIVPLPAPPPNHPLIIPNGPGRCEVCGFATDKTMWVVLPDGWRGFQFKLSTETTSRFVYLAPPDPAQPPTDPAVIEVPLDTSVPDQDVSLAPAY